MRARKRQLLTYSIEEVRALPHEGAAVSMCMRCGGYQQEELSTDIDVDKGTFSKVLSGVAQLQWPKLVLLMDLCQNEIPLIWRVEARGYDFTTARKHLSDLERENFELRKELAEKDRVIEIATQLIHGKVPK